MDTDTDVHLVDPKDFIDAFCIRNGHGSTRGIITGMKGNAVKSFTLPSGTNTYIGGLEDKQCRSWVYFIHNSNNDHLILRYYEDTKTIVEVARGSVLNFSTSWRINQGAVIDGKLLYWTDAATTKTTIAGNPQRKINLDKAINDSKNLEYELYAGIDGQGQFPNGAQYSIEFFDLDGTSQGAPSVFATTTGVENDRAGGLAQLKTGLDGLGTVTTENCDGCKLKISVDATETRIAITSTNNDVVLAPTNHYPLTLEEQHIDMVKYAPKCAPTATYTADATIEYNHLLRDIFQFAYRYLYDDGEKSALSPFSIIPDNIDSDDENDETLNTIVIDFSDTRHNDADGLAIIRGIEIAVRYGNTKPWRSVVVLDPCDFGKDTNEYVFLNDHLYTALSSDDNTTDPEVQVMKLYDFVPILSGGLEYVADQNGDSLLVLGANQEKYDCVDCVDMEFTVQESNDYTISKTLKRGGIYETGIVYADRAGRRSAVCEGPRVEIPYFESTNPSTYEEHTRPQLQWSIDHVPPIWATHYYLVRKRNARHATFAQFVRSSVGFANDPRYTKYQHYDIPAWNSTPSPVAAGPTATHIGISLPWHGEADGVQDMAVFFETEQEQHFLAVQAKDRFRVVGHIETPAGSSQDNFLATPDPVIEREVVGYYLDVTNFPQPELMALVEYESGDETVWSGSFVSLVELIRPREADDGLYYETSDCYDILDAGQAGRRHQGQTQDQIIGTQPAQGILQGGDVYWKRTVADTRFGNPDYIRYESIYHDLKYQTVGEDIGKPNIVDPDNVQRFFFNTFRYSDTYVLNSNINGLSSFRSLNFKSVDRRYSVIKFLAFVDNVLLAICEHKIQPIYVGKNRLLDLSGNNTIGRTTEVLNLADEYVEDWGTQHPESIVVEEGWVYGFDLYKGVVWRRARNGLVAISDYGNTKLFKDKAMDIVAQGATIFIKGGWERQYKMYYLTFDSYGGTGAITYGFEDSELEQFRGWKGRYPFTPEGYGKVGLDFFTFTGGVFYLHEIGNFNTFYGTPYKSFVKFVSNGEPNSIKTFDRNIRVLARYNWVCPEISIPASHHFASGQLSRLNAERWENEEGAWVADLLRDMNDTEKFFLDIVDVPTRQKTALLNGRFLKGEIAIISLEQANGQVDDKLFSATLEYNMSHQTV